MYIHILLYSHAKKKREREASRQSLHESAEWSARARSMERLMNDAWWFTGRRERKTWLHVCTYVLYIRIRVEEEGFIYKTKSRVRAQVRREVFCVRWCEGGGMFRRDIVIVIAEEEQCVLMSSSWLLQGRVRVIVYIYRLPWQSKVIIKLQ